LRTGFRAEAWIAPRQGRELRPWLRFRTRTVPGATRAQNGVHGVLGRQGLDSPHSPRFGPKGRAFLKELAWRELDRGEVDDPMARLDLRAGQIQELDQEIREGVKARAAAQAREPLPGIGPFIAWLLGAEIGDLKRFPTAQHVASYTGLAPSR
jgi:transposase